MTPQSDEHHERRVREDELLRLWNWRSTITVFWMLFLVGLVPTYFLFSSAVAVGLWCLAFSLPLVLSLVVLRLAECPGCNRRINSGNPFPALLAKVCPHCGLPFSPGGKRSSPE